MPHRSSRRQAPDVGNYLRRGRTSGVQPVPRFQIWAITRVIGRRRIYLRTVCSHVAWSFARTMAMPKATVVAPDNASAAADIVGIQNGCIRYVATHRSSPCKRHDSPTFESKAHHPIQRLIPKPRGRHIGSIRLAVEQSFHCRGAAYLAGATIGPGDDRRSINTSSLWLLCVGHITLRR